MAEKSFTSRVKHAWNAFLNKDPTSYHHDMGMSYSYRPDRPRLSRGNERSIVTSVFTRIATDVAQVDIKHVRLDDNGRFLEEMDTGLNNCLTVEANIDQTGRSFIFDAVMSMFDEGVVALAPIDTYGNPDISDSYDILSLRTGKIVKWHPQHVVVNVYNDKTGVREDLVFHKRKIGIIENPFYAVINEPNSTMQRLIRKLNILDAIDEQSGSGKLDLIIQLPYTVKTETKRQQAESRRESMESQLQNSKYGVAYIDSTERVIQLNRPVDNNLMAQIEYLTRMLYSQLGISQEIMDGTADEQTKLSYSTRIVEVILTALVEEMRRKFLTKTARSQSQSIEFFRDPFKLVPVAQLAEIADKFTRNEIMSSNEVRQEIGMKPSKDPRADELRNKNLSEPSNGPKVEATSTNLKEENQNEKV